MQAEAGTEVVQLAYRDAICAALDDELAADPTMVFFGEDVASAGGVFKTNSGLVEAYGEGRVFNTPICENAFIGMALGMAVTGMRPVVEIMFSDFLPTAADAIINELPKFRFMSWVAARVDSGPSTRRPAKRGSWAYLGSTSRPPARRARSIRRFVRRSGRRIPRW
jgi:hypothetical protein